MKVIPQYRVIGPFNYDRIIHNIGKKYVERQDIVRKMERYIFFFLNCVIQENVSKLFESEASCQLPVLLLVIYSFMLNICWPMINIIISVKGCATGRDTIQQQRVLLDQQQFFASCIFFKTSSTVRVLMVNSCVYISSELRIRRPIRLLR